MDVRRVALPFPTSHVDALLQRWPAPWHVARRRNLPITASEAVEIRDAAGRLVTEVDSSTLGDGLVQLVNAAYAVGGGLTPETVEPSIEAVPPWRGQESEEQPWSA